MTNRFNFLNWISMTFISFLTFWALLSFSAQAHIKIEHPWVRASSGPNAALFMKIINTSPKPDKLVGAQVGGCAHCELHTHVEESGIFRMMQVTSFDIPALGEQELKPGENHVMLMKIDAPLKEGDTVPVTLTFAGHGCVQVMAPVKATAAHKCCADH